MRIIIRRTLHSLVVLWLATTTVFVALRALPGDAILAQLVESRAPASTIAERRASLGLNDPLFGQYLRYLGSLVRGDMGTSLVTGLPVTTLMSEQLASTAELALGGMCVALTFGIALGTAARRRAWVGQLSRLLMALALSAPIYWTGTVAVFVISARLGLLPSGGAGRLSHLILPALVLGFSLAGSIGRVTEAALTTVAYSPHVTTARAKGIRARTVAIRHMLYPSLTPILTQIGLQMGFLLSGAVITETIFSRPGLGRLLLDATLRQDYPVVQGIVVWACTAYVLITWLVDVVITLIDPRLRSAP